MATKANLVIDQGTTFSTEINLTDENGDPINLAGYVANSQIRRWYTSTTSSASFSSSINTDTGVITLSLTENQTANLVYGRYVYDVEVRELSTNTVSRVVEGIVTVTPQVTR